VANIPRYRLDFVVSDEHDIDAGSWRPHGTKQHLIIWIDTDAPDSEMAIRDAVTESVRSVLPWSELVEMVKNPV
jgi:hypothetical protein